LAALFELADREFREIRELTQEEITKAAAEDLETQPETESGNVTQALGQALPAAENNTSPAARGPKALDAFNFLPIGKHFFNGYEFEPHKVDGFTQEIVNSEPGITKGKFNFYMRETIGRVKRYQRFFEEQGSNDKMNPFTVIRHCLYLANREYFGAMLTNIARENFEGWLEDNP
jgi:hypothetical protein